MASRKRHKKGVAIVSDGTTHGGNYVDLFLAYADLPESQKPGLSCVEISHDERDM